MGDDEGKDAPVGVRPLGVPIYLVLALVAVVVIAHAILDYDRRFPNGYHLTPALAITYPAIATWILLFCGLRLLKQFPRTSD